MYGGREADYKEVDDGCDGILWPLAPPGTLALPRDVAASVLGALPRLLRVCCTHSCA